MFDGLDHTVQALFIAPRDLIKWADRIRPHVIKMADGSGGRYESGDIFAAIARAELLLWIAIDGPEIACVMLTEIVKYPRLRAMRCVGIVGSRPRRWMHLLAQVEDASRKTFGCTRFEALYPRALGRLLRTSGWREWHVLSEKSL